MPYRITFTDIVLSRPFTFAGDSVPLPAGTYRLRTHETFLAGASFTVLLDTLRTLEWSGTNGANCQLPVGMSELEQARLPSPASRTGDPQDRSPPTKQDRIALDRADNEGMLA